jgi:hypothetical protein
MSSALPNPAQPFHDGGDLPPHLTGVAVMRPIEGGVIHVLANGRCNAAIVVNVDAEDPLSAVFTVDAVIFVPPQKGSTSKWEKANTRPGSVRWANNMQHAEVSENRQLTWHYVSRDCLPAVVLEALARQQQPQAPQP